MEKYKILNIEGYWARYYELKGTDRERWQLLEAELEEFGVYRYSTFESFKRCKYYFISKLKSK